ncbi:Ubiquinone biosynthesis protein COQ4-like protein mitochondrial [Bienertia sinuspersici]
MIGGAYVRFDGWQQAVVALGSAFGALLDPRRADLIAALGETTGKPAFERVLERMKRSPDGRAVLLERPRVISTNVDHAWDLPENTFGAAYAKFMGSRKFSPDDRPPVQFMDTEELAYICGNAGSRVIGGSARFNSKQRSLFLEHYLPWALRAGMNCTDLMCVYYERHFDEDLDVVRKSWGIIPASPPPATKVETK